MEIKIYKNYLGYQSNAIRTTTTTILFSTKTLNKLCFDLNLCKKVFNIKKSSHF